jgi:hypothetical protein
MISKNKNALLIWLNWRAKYNENKKKKDNKTRKGERKFN